ncbi:hypothetical protein BYT27DRAFT_7238629 [Phlegmacium glaucopus]|nr:hypothetical protein BYT27DRAFT_7238629 [Phlegmacium glaucopus]
MSAQAQDLKLLQERQWRTFSWRSRPDLATAYVNNGDHVNWQLEHIENIEHLICQIFNLHHFDYWLFIVSLFTLTASAGGQTIAISSSSTVTPCPGGQTSAISSNPAPVKAFLGNRVLSGIVFGLVALVGLIFFFVIASCLIKRRRKKKLLEDAVPVWLDPVIGTDTMGKQRAETDPPAYRLAPPFN